MFSTAFLPLVFLPVHFHPLCFEINQIRPYGQRRDPECAIISGNSKQGKSGAQGEKLAEIPR